MVIQFSFTLLGLISLLFSRVERRIWGSMRTPFAFIAYPLLAVLFLVVFITPGMGFLPLHFETLLVLAFFLVLAAAASVVMSYFVGEGASRPSRMEEAPGGNPWHKGADRSVGTLEYLVVAGILLAVFASSLIHYTPGEVSKGELSIGGISGHIMNLGVAYLIIAMSQKKGAMLVRGGLICFVLLILLANQVKYIIMLPLACVVLYKWASRQWTIWKILVIVLVVPMGIVSSVMFMSVASNPKGTQISIFFFQEMATRMIGYLASGTLGLDRLLLRGHLSLINTEGIEYIFAPFINTLKFAFGDHQFYDVINRLYLPIHSSDIFLTSNVFTLFGSLLFRGGWLGAIPITFGYIGFSYGVWFWWHAQKGALACAAGAFWVVPLLFSWHDPFFIHLSSIEIFSFLWIRGRMRGLDR
ncbi:hypothetical protein GALL_468410 [mine drainage metagenome]|uniref:Oligosaccharide repeat unit polymerase n=1 Tax=mine drainage metagenome TaxID=410659 RepID=A0A1J5PJ51_9ZZZZ